MRVRIVFTWGVSEALQILLADAQTSGGLLLAVSPEKVAQAEETLHEAGAPIVVRIGELVVSGEKAVEVA